MAAFLMIPVNIGPNLREIRKSDWIKIILSRGADTRGK